MDYLQFFIYLFTLSTKLSTDITHIGFSTINNLSTEEVVIGG